MEVEQPYVVGWGGFDLMNENIAQGKVVMFGFLYCRVH